MMRGVIGGIIGGLVALSARDCVRYVLFRWHLRRAAKDLGRGAIRQHIKHHVDELDSADAAVWAASMQNLLDLFVRVHRLSPSWRLRAERLVTKWENHGKPYTSPVYDRGAEKYIS